MAETNKTREIAIIGAGLAGLALALSLHKNGTNTTIYETRPEPLNIGGAVMLSPNALRILEALGLYEQVRSKGYNFEQSDFQSTSGELIDTYEFGSHHEYGYKANRIYRFELIDILLDSIRSKGIDVNYGRKFSHITEETTDRVTWQFSDGTTESASILIGADGIHSAVRKYLYPDLTPKYIGMTGITASIPASQLPTSITKIDKPTTIISKTKGAFVIAPQKVDGSEYLIGKQKRMPEQTREGWDAIHADKDAAISFLQRDNADFGEIAIHATRDIPHHNINIWPFYMVPKLDRWTSANCRVVLVGDAAHAIPPSAGQGISQAFEDVFMLARLLKEVDDGHTTVGNAMGFWQEFRQKRVDGVLMLNKEIDERRVPREEGEMIVVKKDWDLNWLYGIDLDVVVDGWIADQKV